MMFKKVIVVVLLSMILAVMILAAINIFPFIQERNHNIALGREWADLLKKHPSFSATPTGYAVEVNFTYAAPSDENLRILRDTYNLESIAGQGSETDRIINLTRMVSQLTGHANNPEIPEELNALNLIHLAKDEHMLINCYMKTVILNEVFLSMGFSSRWTHLFPHSNEEEESHYITSVYSQTLGKWILMDPDFGVYVTDEKANILGVAGIRSRLIAGEPLEVKDLNTSRSVLTRAWSGVKDRIEGTDYLWYLSKNIFKIQCPQVSMFNQRSMPDKMNFELIPDGYREELLKSSQMTRRGEVFYINDEELFWQKPIGQVQ